MTRQAVITTGITVFLDHEGAAKTIRARLDRPVDAARLEAMVLAADAEAARGFDGGAIERLVAPEGEATPAPELMRRAALCTDRLEQFGRSSTPPIAESGPVRLVVVMGRITRCVVDPRWLARAHLSSLADALQTALATARTAYHAERRERERIYAELERTLGDSKATLRGYGRG